jgi:hypothetical protein
MAAEVDMDGDGTKEIVLLVDAGGATNAAHVAFIFKFAGRLPLLMPVKNNIFRGEELEFGVRRKKGGASDFCALYETQLTCISLSAGTWK